MTIGKILAIAFVGFVCGYLTSFFVSYITRKKQPVDGIIEIDNSDPDKQLFKLIMDTDPETKDIYTFRVKQNR